MTFTNLTRENGIAANSYCIDIGGRRIVLDSGLHPRHDGPLGLPDLDALRQRKVDAIFITHAHLDHIGSLPVLARHQPQARIFMTEPTYFLGQAVLRNSINVMKRKAEISRDTQIQLYTHAELDRCIETWQACRIQRPWSLEGHPTPVPSEPTFEFYQAGHILGATGLLLRSGNETLFYTGDVSYTPQTICPQAQFPTDPIDTLIIETTRGANNKTANYSRTAELDRLATRITEVFDRGGSVLMPAFALGKTQEMCVALHQMMARNQIPSSTIHIGGLGWKFSQIYDSMMEHHPHHAGKLRIHEHIRPELFNSRTIGQFRPQRRHIYLLSAGMMTENTTSNIAATRFLSDPRHAVFFIGYCDPESPAGRLQAAATTTATVELDPHFGPQPIRCDIEAFDLTAHAQREELLHYALQSRAKNILLVHGDPTATEWFEGALKREQPHLNVIIPTPSTPYELS